MRKLLFTLRDASNIFLLSISASLIVSILLVSANAEVTPGSSVPASGGQPASLPRKAILEFEESNYKQLMEKHEWIVLLMYTPWNRRSLEMLFHFNRLIDLLPRKVLPSVEIARVNCQAQKAVCQHFHEFQFPTIRILRRNMPNVIYQSFWDISYVAKWVTRYLTALEQLDGSREQFLRFTGQNNWMIAVFRDKSADYVEYVRAVFNLCQEYGEYNFAFVMYEDALAEGFFSPAPPWNRTRSEKVLFDETWKSRSMVLLNTERGLRLFSTSFGDKFNQVELDNFMFGYVQPVIVPFVDRQSIVRYLDYGQSDFSSVRPVLIYFARMDDPALQYKVSVLKACAFSLLGRVSIVYTDRSRTVPLQHKFMPSGQSPDAFEDLVVLVFPRRHVHFVYPLDASVRLRSIVDWCIAALNSKILPTSRSGPHALISSDGEESIPIVLHITDSVCGFCKRWQPFIQEMEKELQNNRTAAVTAPVRVVTLDVRHHSFPFNKEATFSQLMHEFGDVASVDPLANELVPQLPQTLLIAPGRRPLIYRGPRNVQSLIKFALQAD
eukprot:TRINITY_DN8734_c0_g1_i1.p1 TRINITY_DN8734_c0_g1~~TRINITY_DN8734_c0_g1_i1.p1  ORF type:complete len:552 (+),score=73.89 TRINITY_DN8734_c0_g1_i1:183-1838(+)